LTFDQLLRTPTKEEIRDLLFKVLQGIGITEHDGYSPGTVQGTGTPAGTFSIEVLIIAAGDLGTGTFQWSADGGGTFSATATIPSGGTYAMAGTGCSLVFAAGPSGSSSFLAGDLFTFGLEAGGYPVTTWQPGDASRTLVENDAEALEDLYRLVKNVTAGGLIDYATGDWLDLVAGQFYDVDRQAGTVTEGVVALTAAAGAGPFNLTNGSTWFLASNGLRFVLAQDVTVPLSSAVTGVLVRAEAQGSAYNVGNGTITGFSTSVPGLAVNNPDPGDGSWVSTAGTDKQSDGDYRAAAKGRWQSLAYGSPESVYVLWAKASDASITKVNARPSLVTGGQVDIYLAGNAGPVGAPAVAAAQAYIDARAPLGVTAAANNTTPLAQTVAGTVYVQNAYLAQAIAQCSSKLAALINGKPIGGTLYRAEIIEELMSPVGVRNVVLATPAADVVAAANEVFTLTQSLAFIAV